MAYDYNTHFQYIEGYICAQSGAWIAQSIYQRAIGWTAGVRSQAGAKYFSLLHIVQTGSGLNPDPYTVDPGRKGAEA